MAAGSKGSSGWITTLVINGIALSILAPPFSCQCVDKTYNHGGRECCTCAAGQYVVEHCTENLKYGKCEYCKDETYSSHPTNQKFCEPCTSCSQIYANLEELEPCTHSSNRKCQCKKDHYCSSGPEICRVCQPCTVCDPEGIKVPCTAKNDTVCNARTADGLPPGTIVAIVVSCLVIVILVVLGVVYFWKKKDRGQLPGTRNTNANDEALQPLKEVDLHPLSPEIADIIGWQDMKDIAISTGITAEKINSVQHDHRSNHEQTLELLNIFIEKHSIKAASQLITMLRKKGKNEKADKIERLLREAIKDVEPV